MKNSLQDIINKINESSKIALSFHTSPDGDSTGSSLALMQGLRSIGKNAYIVSKEAVPSSYKFLPFSNEITGEIKKVQNDTDLFIILDCGNVERINTEEEIPSNSFTLINIDHHISNDLYGELNYVDIKASSMGEIVFEMLNLLKISITKDIAKCIYTSILTDTGSFRHSNTTPKTHSIVSKLLETEIDFSEIHRLIFDNKEFCRIKLLGKAIEGMYLTCNDKVSFIKITSDLFKELGIEDNETSDLVSLGLKVNTVEVAILLKEAKDGTKVSLRSKDAVDVRKIAEVYGGGGHIKASGAFIKAPIEEAEQIIKKALEEELIK
ncbi:MAG: bifunctional oligoribonuclease/PAP phosphatase NrnA [Clostridiaceae bacterium]